MVIGKLYTSRVAFLMRTPPPPLLPTSACRARTAETQGSVKLEKTRYKWKTCLARIAVGQAWRTFLGPLLHWTVDVEGILAGPHGNFEERNEVFELSIIINYYTIVINNACNYNCVMNS